jgi:outer membrane lipoprotein carrier protein
MFFAVAAHADSLDSLAQFLKQTRSLRADFVQVVAAPAKEGRPSKPKTSSGSFAFVRPSVFRFDYSKPFVQNIVADGSKLWLFDADLNQVTVRNQAQALGSTPATLMRNSLVPRLSSIGRQAALAAAAGHEQRQRRRPAGCATSGAFGLRLSQRRIVRAPFFHHSIVIRA